MKLPNEFIRPNYQDGSIANIPPTVAALLGVPFDGLTPLRDECWQPFAGHVKRVVVLIIDAFGSHLLRCNEEKLSSFVGQADIQAELTSVFPSTTVNALSCLWTGLAPAQHGLVGLHLFFPETGVMGQMITLTPAFRNIPDALVDNTIEPEAFLHGLGVAEQLANAGIPTYAFKGREIVHSSLSMMHGRGVAGNYGAVSFADMMWQMRHLLEEKAGEPMYVCGYWPTIDTLSHIYSPYHEVVDLEIQGLLHQVQTQFLQDLTAQARQDTVFFIVADHGQTPTPPEYNISMRHHPDLWQMLLMRQAGGARMSYLYARQGQVSSVLEYVEEKMPAVAYPSATLLEEGLFGPAPHAPDVLARMGDITLLMDANHNFMMPQEEAFLQRLIGMHGGLSSEEMMVPWLGFKLG